MSRRLTFTLKYSKFRNVSQKSRLKTYPRSSDVSFDLSERVDLCSDVTVYIVGQ